MLQITLDIENNEDEQLVVSLLKRRGIHFSMKNEITPIPNKETLAAIEEAKNPELKRYDCLETMWTELDND